MNEISPVLRTGAIPVVVEWNVTDSLAASLFSNPFLCLRGPEKFVGGFGFTAALFGV